MTYRQALQVLIDKGFDQTASWKDAGSYSVAVPDKGLLELLKPYRTTSKDWTERMSSAASVARKTA